MSKIKRLFKWLSKLSRNPNTKAVTLSSALKHQIDKLPIELVEQIFIQAALDPTLLPLTLSLMRVSRWVHAILQPLLYRSVYLHTDAQAQKFLHTITAKPDICRFIVTFDSPQVNIFKRAWPKRHIADLCLPYVAALDKQAPHLRTLAQIFPILFLADSHLAKLTQKDKNSQSATTATTSSAPQTSNLRSTTIHALTLSPPFDVGSEDGGYITSQMQLPPDVTLSGFGTSSLMKWNFTHVERLRFTSVVNGGTLRISELLNLPNLTHLALPLWRNTVETTKRLLESPKLKRLALFVLFEPISEETMARVAAEGRQARASGQAPASASTLPQQGSTPSPTTIVVRTSVQPSSSAQGVASSTSTVVASTSRQPSVALASTSGIPPNTPLAHGQGTTPSLSNPSSTGRLTDPNASTSSLLAVYTESEVLRGIEDERLILFNIREMVSMCRVPSHKFWSEVELRSSHIGAHVVLGRLRSIAGQSLS